MPNGRYVLMWRTTAWTPGDRPDRVAPTFEA